MTDTSREALIKELRVAAELLQIGKVEDWDGLAAEILQAADMLEADNRVKVGDSNFESWYAETKIQQMGTKQRYREAYEAGLNEAQQVAVPAGYALAPLEPTEEMIEYGKKCKAESEQVKSTQWVAQEIDEFEIRVVSPSGEAWRLRSADRNDIFNNFIWRWAQSLIETKEVKP